MANVRSAKTVPGLPLFSASDGTPITIDRMPGNFGDSRHRKKGFKYHKDETLSYR
jgi:hypothetical protein